MKLYLLAAAMILLLATYATAQDRGSNHRVPPKSARAPEATVTPEPAQVDGADSMDLSSSVVKVFSVLAPPDYAEPWRPGPRDEVSGSGVILEGRRVLTNAHNVANQLEVTVQREGAYEQYPAKVAFINDACDLALLEIPDAKFFAGAAPVALGTLPKLRQRVDVYGYPIGGENISTTRGVVSRIEVDFSAHSGEPVLMVQLDAAINHGNSGGPVIVGGKLAGIATQRNEDAERIGSMVPTPVIRQFLDDVADGKVDGVPGPGFRYQQLQNSALRAFFKVPPGPDGLLVKSVKFGGSAWGVLLPGDVVKSVDGVTLYADGTVPYEHGGRVLFTHLFARHQVGEKLPLEILRGGVAQKVELKLAREPYLVPALRSDVEADYFIIGGVLLEPFTADYYSYLLGSGDKEQAADVPSELTTLWNSGDPTPQRRGLVVISRLLPDEMTRGLGDMRDEVVSTIDGAVPVDFDDAVRRIEGSKAPWVDLVTLTGAHVAIERARAKATLPALLARERIPSDRSSRLLRK